MKIAVFGDSFADRHLTESWWNLLEERHGHNVRSFGLDASSIYFSARLLDLYASQFDLVIWALTESDRVSVFVDSNLLHLGPGGFKSQDQSFDLQLRRKYHQIYQEYLKYIFDRREIDFAAKNVTQNLMTRHGNVMILPCFYHPLQQDFYLYQVSQKESQHYFSDKDLAQTWREHHDLRQGHLLPRNHEILADLLSENLEPGIFQTNLDCFVAENISAHQYFKSK